MSNEISEDVLKIQEILKNEELYETGMSADDMLQIYETLNKSKSTANDENEYRELLSQTDLNCLNAELLKPEVNCISVELLKPEEKFINESDKISDTEFVLSESDTNLNANDSMKDKIDIVFNFDATSSYKTDMPIKQNKNLISVLYHQKELLKLPEEIKIKVITSYLQYEKNKIVFEETKYLDQWDNIIKLDKKNEFAEEACEKPEILECTNVSDENIENTRRSNRVVKRKNYAEIDSDEERRTVLNKKKKSNDIDFETITENSELPKFSELPSTSTSDISFDKLKNETNADNLLNPSLNKKFKLHDDTITNSVPLLKDKWYSRHNNKKYEKRTFTPEVSDRTHKVLSKVKVEEEKKKKLVVDDYDSEEDIFPNSKNIHTEVTPKLRKGKYTTNKKAVTKTPKKLNMKLTNEEEIENNETEIQISNFYGKNKENELDASNNNKTTFSEMIQCPICSQSCQESEIEYHASRCE